MTDWLDEVAERAPYVPAFSPKDATSDVVVLLVLERDRLVRIARGLRELAKQLDRDGKVPEVLDGWRKDWLLRGLAAELRKLEAE